MDESSEKGAFIPLDEIKVVKTRHTTSGPKDGVLAEYIPPYHSDGPHELRFYARDESVLKKPIDDCKNIEFLDPRFAQLRDLWIEKAHASVLNPTDKIDFDDGTIRHEEMHKNQEIRFDYGTLRRSLMDLRNSLPYFKEINMEFEKLNVFLERSKAFAELQGTLAGMVNLENPTKFYSSQVLHESLGILGLVGKAGSDYSLLDIKLDSMRKGQEVGDASIIKYLMLFTVDSDIYSKIAEGSLDSNAIANLLYTNLSLAIKEPEAFVAKVTDPEFTKSLDFHVMQSTKELKEKMDEMLEKYRVDKKRISYYRKKST